MGRRSKCRLGVSPDRVNVVDRKSDILANAGVHIGGTDFDRLLSLSKVMPHLEYRSLSADKKRDLPSSYYFDLASWPRINNLYQRHVAVELRQVRRDAAQPELVDRLIRIVERRQGHALAARVEETKIALTECQDAVLEIPFID